MESAEHSAANAVSVLMDTLEAYVQRDLHAGLLPEDIAREVSALIVDNVTAVASVYLIKAIAERVNQGLYGPPMQGNLFGACVGKELI